ncbi:MAG: UbiD family decarboxylase, partial [Deltaproteobacteria bacterium]|nr:UbiD family decarboxylase [Deltaproteobacteria bacterium]
MIYKDLRGFIKQVEGLGALRHIDGADPHFELGGITEVAAGTPECPALLFDRIKGLKPGFRVFTNATTTPQRAALALGLDPRLAPLDALKAWMQKRQKLILQPPARVNDAPFLENSFRRKKVDLATLPAPHWHRKDGGPFIGSGSLVIMRDPDSGWINASIYRIQVHDRTKVTIQFDHQGRHGAIIARKYWDQGKACPVAVVNGPDPALFIAGFEYLPEGQSEYDFAGAIKGAPIEVLNGPLTGLPVPAQAEIILEGELLPASKMTLPEGPFGEFTGYYAADKRPCPVMEVKAIHHRNDPILLGSPPMKPPRFHFGLPFRAAGIWSNLEMAGVTDVVGVWQHVAQLMTVVAIRQRYAGHAKRAGLIAAANSYMGRLVVVVDDD